MTTSTLPQTLTVAEAARLMQFGETTLRRAIRRGQLRAEATPRGTRIDLEDLADLQRRLITAVAPAQGS